MGRTDGTHRCECWAWSSCGMTYTATSLSGACVLLHGYECCERTHASWAEDMRVRGLLSSTAAPAAPGLDLFCTQPEGASAHVFLPHA